MDDRLAGAVATIARWRDQEVEAGRSRPGLAAFAAEAATSYDRALGALADAYDYRHADDLVDAARATIAASWVPGRAAGPVGGSGGTEPMGGWEPRS
jgi:hypothetical protein